MVLPLHCIKLLFSNMKVINDLIIPLANFPPNITGPGTFEIFLGRESVYSFTVSDVGDTFTLMVDASAADESFIVDEGTGMYSFHWNIQTIANLSLTIIATDSAGVSSQLIPQLLVCGCTNGGECTLNGVLDLIAPVVVLACICPEGTMYIDYLYYNLPPFFSLSRCWYVLLLS